MNLAAVVKLIGGKPWLRADPTRLQHFCKALHDVGASGLLIGQAIRLPQRKVLELARTCPENKAYLQFVEYLTAMVYGAELRKAGAKSIRGRKARQRRSQVPKQPV